MRELNWNPEISISEGIKNTIEWYLNYKEEMKNIEFKFTYEK
jgi:dTDP-D-glucose 4,6-dehydratase